jgi:NAD(P)-dependent dehydrogenase (short-subunit alcohol dehydrogenase family)
VLRSMTVGAKIEGWSDSLRAELAPLGIGVTCIEPGPFRTDWAGRSLRQTPSKIADYADSAGKRHTGTRQSDGTQPGDPVRAGEAMVAIARNADAPRHLVLGAWGIDVVLEDLHKRVNEIESQRELSLSADYDA